MNFIAYKTLREITKEFKDRLNSIAKKENDITGIPSGFEKLDAITQGFQSSNLILVGGVAGIGKTSFAVSLIRKIAINNQCPISFFSLEMTSQQLMMRIISQETNIAVEKLCSGLLNEREMELVTTKIAILEDAPLYVNDYPFQTVSDIEETLSYSPPEFTKIIIIDSLQFIKKNKNDKVGKVLNKRELTKITFELKELATKLNIAIIALFDFRLPKEKEKYFYSRRPILADVRKYAPIDTFADLVLLLYRPEYYNIEKWDDYEQSPAAGEAEIIVAKNTNGNLLDKIRVKYEGAKGLFDNLTFYKKKMKDDLIF